MLMDAMHDERGHPPPNDAVRPRGKDFLELDPLKFPAAFAADLPEAQARFMAVPQRPIWAAAFSARTPRATWREKPTFAILATGGRALNLDLQRWMYKRSASKMTELKAGHAAFASQPAAVAKFIEEAARAAR